MGMAHLVARRFARSEVKTAGMCCAMTTGKGKFAGNEGKSLANASGPPVETPTVTILSWAECNGEAWNRISGRRAWTMGRETPAAAFGARTGKRQSALILGTKSR